MSSQTCISSVCFYALDVNGLKIFGFAEYLTGLALLVLAWTIADTKYQFRVDTAPLPLKRIAFVSVALIGLLTLLTDLWRAQQWLVPVGTFLTPAIWQALLGLTFLLTFLSWAWFAFIRPSSYGPRNSKRFVQAVYDAILRGSPVELAIIADEVARSAPQLIQYAPDAFSRRRYVPKSGDFGPGTDPLKKMNEVEGYAHDFLLLIADRKFCRAVVSSAPALALALIREVAARRKHTVAIGTFTRNIVGEALANKDSFLFHETKGYETGLLGHQKPLSLAIFGDYAMLSGVGTALDADLASDGEWDADMWQAYCRAALIAVLGYADAGLPSDSPCMFRLKSRLGHAAWDIYKLDGTTSLDWRESPHAKLRAVVDFLTESLKILDSKPISQYTKLRVRQRHGPDRSVYDLFAELIVDVVFCASTVRSPMSTCWTIQRNTVWSAIFDSFSSQGQASKIVKHKARRLLYNEVVEMERFPNFKGARLLSICLNCMGIRRDHRVSDKDSRALRRSLLSWTKKNYALLYVANSAVGDACFVEGMAYEPEHSRIVTTYPAGGLRTKPSFVYFEVDRLPKENSD